MLTVQHYSYAGGGAYYQWGSPRPFAFTQVRGDQVWAVTNSTERFYLDFGAGPGFVDSVANCTNGYSPQWIDSVGTETLNGQPVRIQWRRAYARAGYPNPPPTNVLVEYTGAVVERLGYPYAKMFPIPGCTTDPEYPELAYYHDAALSFGTRPLLVTGLRESAVARALRVAPNPSATGLFRLEGFTDARISYAVLDPQGRRVRAGQLTAAAPELNLTDLPAGLYLLRGAVDGHVFTRRLVRE